MLTATANVQNWTYKTKAEIQALDDKTLMKVNEELLVAIHTFTENNIPISDEMFWQLMVIPPELAKRKLAPEPKIF